MTRGSVEHPAVGVAVRGDPAVDRGARPLRVEPVAGQRRELGQRRQERRRIGRPAELLERRSPARRRSRGRSVRSSPHRRRPSTAASGRRRPRRRRAPATAGTAWPRRRARSPAIAADQHRTPEASGCLLRPGRVNWRITFSNRCCNRFSQIRLPDFVGDLATRLTSTHFDQRRGKRIAGEHLFLLLKNNDLH